MYAQLGDIIFEGLFSYHEYEDTGETKYAEVEKIGGKPDLQHTGEELDVIALSVRLHESFCEPSVRYGQFKAHRLAGDILPFVDGYGNIIGNFVIDKIKRTVNNTDTYGRVTLCELEISLKEYVDPNVALTISSNAKDNAFALNSTTPSVNIVSPPANANADIFLSMSDLSDNSGGAIQSVNNAVADPANVASYFKNAVAAANAAYQAASDVQSKVEGYIAQGIGAYTGMQDGGVSVQNNITALKAAIASGNIANAATCATVLGSSVYQLNTTALPIQELLILR